MAETRLSRRAYLLGAAFDAGQMEPGEAYFPSRLHQFVWRNWELANLDAMARVVGASSQQLNAIGTSMGLPAKRRLSDDYLKRIYITVIRQNWFLLPEEQIIELLGWTDKRFRFTLKEDDFLDVKLGAKPACAWLSYHSPTDAENRRAAEIRALLMQWFGARLNEPGQPRFAFVDELSRPVAQRASRPQGRPLWSPRFCYSYFALYGDPLLEGDAAGLPDGYLQRAAEAGMGGVWIQAVLNTLAPSRQFPEFGEGWQTRLRNLRALVARADKAGLKIYLYLNEPRAMPASFFAARPELRGSKAGGGYAMCTSAEPVRDWIRASLSHVFGEVPGLGGVFSITMSENHTNCFSHSNAWGEKLPVAPDCPRCSKRTAADAIAELVTTFREGIREHSRTAEIISWDWGWGRPLAEALVPKLPKDTALMSISEWSKPVYRGGVDTVVGEYSMSVVGPGPRARRHWALAKQAGLRTLAKAQFNNTWEISAVPWIPVLPLVVEHARGLAEAGIDGVLASWTCGGYPSPNLRAANAFAFEPRPQPEAVLAREAERMYGAGQVADAVAAWRAFSEAFQEFPYGVAIYVIPTQHGPANLLRLKPTGLKPGMILFPHDAYKAWCGAYPPAVALKQFRALAFKWRAGLVRLQRAAQRSGRAEARRELAIAGTCLHHFESTANQLEFYLERDSASRSKTKMLELVRAERELARRQYFVAKGDSLIGYEASNHYYYTPLGLVEKMLNCDWLEHQLA